MASPLAATLDAAVAEAALSLGHLDLPLTERNLKQELRAALQAGSVAAGGFAVEPTEWSPNLGGWPGVGGVDIAITGPSSVPAFVELKWGAGTLYNCAWDALKLALAVAENRTEDAFMVAGAPVHDWTSSAIGSELFADGEWSAAAIMAAHASSFARWRVEVKTRPRVLPREFRCRAAGRHPMKIDGVAWELRVVKVTAPGNGAWVAVDADGHVSDLVGEPGMTDLLAGEPGMADLLRGEPGMSDLLDQLDDPDTRD